MVASAAAAVTPAMSPANNWRFSRVSSFGLRACFRVRRWDDFNMSGPFQGNEMQFANQRHVAAVAEGFGLRSGQPTLFDPLQRVLRQTF